MTELISIFRQRLKTIAFGALGSKIVLKRRLAQVVDGNVLTILNLHRVDDVEGSAYEAMDPKLFDDLLCWLKKHFDIICFTDLSTERTARVRPRLILSFDDGYKDFIEIVMPILEKHKLCANQNVIPDCIETGRPPMNVILQDFIGAAPVALLRELDIPWLDIPLDPNKRVFSGMRASRIFKKKPFCEQTKIFTQLLPQMERFDDFRTTPMMSIGEVRQVADSHEIGAHSWSHASMAVETNEYLLEDLRSCRSYFFDHIGCVMNIYAFPNGSCREEQIELLQREGIEHVLLVEDDFSMPRTNVHTRFTMYAKTASEARFRALGGLKPVSIKK